MKDEPGIPFITLSLCLIPLAAYWYLGPAPEELQIKTLEHALTGVVMHGNTAHLSFNVLLIFLGGQQVEKCIGALRTLALAIVCATVGTVAQYYLVDPNFVGMSGVAYGLVGYAIISLTPKDQLFFSCAMIALALGAEAVYLSDDIAVYTHITSALIGGSYAMFNSLFGNSTPKLKPMQLTHISRVVAIINETDDDDAEEAEAGFISEGVEDMFVLMHKGEVIGVTGYNRDEQVYDIAWLSWTYLAKEHAGQGYGSQMLNDLLGKLKDQGIRKLFIATSDYKDFGRPIYAAAHKMYEDFGASVELKIPQYHGTYEAKIIYGLDNPEFVPNDTDIASTQTGIEITGVSPEPETDDVVGFNWVERPVGVAGIQYAIDKAKSDSARMAVLAIPSDLSNANEETLKAHEFTNCGMLENYYKIGLHQVWWVCSLQNQTL